MLQHLDPTDRQERPDDAPTTRVVYSAPPERPRHDLSLPKILAGALAAASAAVAASWLGVAGTVIGAVIASVVVSVTTALYAHPLERSSQVIRETMPVVPARYRRAEATGVTETMLLDPSEAPATTAETSLTAAQPRRVRWATVVLSSIVMLIVGFGVITGVEALIGRPLSAIGSDGGGTTLSHIIHRSSGGSGGSHSTPSNGGQAGDTTQSPTTGPTDGPTTDTPTTDQPTQTEPTPTEPTDPTGTGPTAPQPTGADGATAAP
jgi:hypothetical protein